MKKILCPVDFSEVSVNAIEFAAKLGDAYNSSLTLINVFTEKDFNKILDTDTITKEYNEKLEIARQKLDKMCAEVMRSEKRHGLLSCQHLLKSGKFAETVLETAREDRYDLIVMGSTGATNLAEKYIGSSTLTVMEDAPCSVLVVPSEVHFHKIKSIVYATDYQEEDKVAIQIVMALASNLNAKIDVLHVSHSSSDANLAIYKDFVEEMESFIHYDKLKFHQKVFSSTTKGLKAFMHEKEADLLVLLNKKRNFFSNLFHHSITKDLYEFSDFPFLVINT